MSNIETFLEKYYGPNDPILLGCSTGPDSMFLLYEILETKFAQNLVACYFNHKTRPETDEEESFIEALGIQIGFTVEIGECDFEKIKKIYPSKSFEELAREKRYAFFDALMHIYGSKHVLTAHHMDDKIETFFFNLARGSKLTGLINMTESSGTVLRPLLGMMKSEIVTYLDSNNLKYSIDETNFDTDITRNFLRHEIVPRFSKINSSYKQNITKTLTYFESLKKHIDAEVVIFLKEQGIEIFNSGKFKINTLKINGYFYIKNFLLLSDFLQKEIIRHIYYISNGKSTIGLSEANITEVIKFINGKNNKTVKEIKKMKMKKDNTIIIF